MQRSTSFLILLALGIGFVLFKVKYEVVEIEEKFLKTLAQVTKEEENIHILKAEWSHLNEPQRLQSLANKYLDIGPMKTQQVVALFDPSSHGTIDNGGTHTHLASQKGVE
ncbi:MAG: hypothetical protein HYX35_03445 [Proteobacteria bacterium]|nr:hypothetical protein [Pseudomonadota bacterium]